MRDTDCIEDGETGKNLIWLWIRTTFRFFLGE